MPITDMQPAEKVWGNFGCIRIDCRTLCFVTYAQYSVFSFPRHSTPTFHYGILISFWETFSSSVRYKTKCEVKHDILLQSA